jgi:predicted secreted protein
MAGTDGSYAGLDVLVEFTTDFPPTGTSTWKRIGAVRGKESGTEWDTADATADDSPGRAKELVTTFKSNNHSYTGVARREDSKNQKELEKHIDNPPAAGPCGGIRTTRPYQGVNLVRITPVIFQSFRSSDPHDAESTWSLEAPSTGPDITAEV